MDNNKIYYHHLLLYYYYLFFIIIKLLIIILFLSCDYCIIIYIMFDTDSKPRCCRHSVDHWSIKNECYLKIYRYRYTDVHIRFIQIFFTPKIMTLLYIIFHIL